MLTDKQREQRRFGIGASDSPIIMGYSNYKTPYELYCEKIGLIEADDEVTEQQYWGNALEPLIIKRFAEENNVDITFPDTVYHPKYNFIFANLDGYIASENAVVEAKSVNSYQRKEWDMQLRDGIPMSYLIQIAKQCLIMNASRGYCAVLIGGMEYKQFVYERDKELEEIIIQADIDFWDCVQNKREPQFIRTSDYRLKYPTPSPDKIANSTFKTEHALQSLINYKAQSKELEEKEEFQKMQIMSQMGDAEYLMGHHGELLVTWKANKKGTRVFNIK